MHDDEFTKRLKNAYLTLPLASIEIEKGTVLKSKGQKIDLEKLDTQFLSMKLIDFLAERLAAGQGASADEIHSCLTPYLETMCPSTTEDERIFVTTRILERLANGSDGYRAFRHTFFNPSTNEHALSTYKLIEWWQPEFGEAHVYKATPEAVTLFLSMLTIDPILEHAAQNFLIKHLLKAGHVAGAVEVAKKASGTSRGIQATIQNRLLELRRNPRKSGWVDDILPRLKEATDHVDQRLAEERVLLETIGEMLGVNELETEQHSGLIRLKNLVEECLRRHLALSCQISDAVDHFHEYQVYAFKSPRLSVKVSPERDLLPDILDMRFSDAIDMSEMIGCHFLGPTPPKVFDMYELLEMYFDYHSRTAETAIKRTPKIEEDDISLQIGINPYQEERIRLWIVELVASGQAKDFKGVLQCLEAARESPESDDITCTIHVMKTIFRAEVELGIEAVLEGEFEHKYAAGKNLALQHVGIMPQGDKV